MQIKDFVLNDETVLEIGKFTILWNLFEKKYCNNNCSPRVLKRIAPKITIDSDAMKSLSVVLNARRIWLNMLIPEYTQLSLHPKNAKASSEEDIKCMEQFLKMEGEELVLGSLLIIHRIRNNMMHGLKTAKLLDDQIELFKAVNLVIENIEKKREKV